MRRLAPWLVLLLAACSGPAAEPETTAGPVTVAPSTGAPSTTVDAAPSTTAAPSTAAPVTTTTTTAPATTTTTAVPIEEVVVVLEPVATGFDQPVFLTAPAGDPRQFIVDQPGRIWVVGDADPEVFLDVRDVTVFGGERGLLGLAFHPDYSSNGRFFINHVSGGATVVAEYAASPDDPDRADPGSRRVLLEIDQPASNHNGGMIAFGPDGLLWIGMGDGGRADDFFGHGQDATTLHGAMLRIDVDAGPDAAYAIPAGNAPVDGTPTEVWAIGVRNPWRFSFDGDLLYVADVGQNRWEEVSVVDTAAAAGLPNFGWPILEASHCFQRADCDPAGLILPVLEYDHGAGCSITGGYVYRGEAIPALAGHYFYSDWCSGWVRSFRWDGSAAVDQRDWTDVLGTVRSPTSFGVDGFGELYLVSGGGSVARFASP